MTCDQVREDLELYALGSFGNDEAAGVSEHIAGCAGCRDALQRAIALNALISREAPLVDPPATLRRRVKGIVSTAPRKRTAWLPWLIAATAVVALIISVLPRTSLVANPPATAQSALRIISAPGTHAVSVQDPKLPELRGSLYIHQKLGLALVIDQLPAAPAGWKYESWVVPKAGAPQPVETFQPDRSGQAVSVVPGPVNIETVSAVAVSMEPLEAHPTTPTKLLFSTTLG